MRLRNTNTITNKTRIYDINNSTVLDDDGEKWRLIY